MEVTVKQSSGKDTGRKVTLNPEVFGVEPNDHAIYLDVKQVLANRRQGTHKSKQRNEVHGTTKKFKLNKKVKRLARVSALSYKAKENNITVLDSLEMGAVKTKDYVNMLNGLALNNKKTLVVLPESNNNVYLSSRNLGHSKVVNASDLNTYDILNAQSLVLVEASLPIIEKTLSK